MKNHCNGIASSLDHAPIEYDCNPCPLCAEMRLRAESGQKYRARIEEVRHSIERIEDGTMRRRLRKRAELDAGDDV